MGDLDGQPIITPGQGNRPVGSAKPIARRVQAGSGNQDLGTDTFVSADDPLAGLQTQGAKKENPLEALGIRLPISEKHKFLLDTIKKSQALQKKILALQEKLKNLPKHRQILPGRVAQSLIGERNPNQPYDDVVKLYWEIKKGIEDLETSAKTFIDKHGGEELNFTPEDIAFIQRNDPEFFAILREHSQLDNLDSIHKNLNEKLRKENQRNPFLQLQRQDNHLLYTSKNLLPVFFRYQVDHLQDLMAQPSPNQDALMRQVNPVTIEDEAYQIVVAKHHINRHHEVFVEPAINFLANSDTIVKNFQEQFRLASLVEPPSVNKLNQIVLSLTPSIKAAVERKQKIEKLMEERAKAINECKKEERKRLAAIQKEVQDKLNSAGGLSEGDLQKLKAEAEGLAKTINEAALAMRKEKKEELGGKSFDELEEEVKKINLELKEKIEKAVTQELVDSINNESEKIDKTFYAPLQAALENQLATLHGAINGDNKYLKDELAKKKAEIAELEKLLNNVKELRAKKHLNVEDLRKVLIWSTKTDLEKMNEIHSPLWDTFKKLADAAISASGEKNVQKRNVFAELIAGGPVGIGFTRLTGIQNPLGPVPLALTELFGIENLPGDYHLKATGLQGLNVLWRDVIQANLGMDTSSTSSKMITKKLEAILAKLNKLDELKKAGKFNEFVAEFQKKDIEFSGKTEKMDIVEAIKQLTGENGPDGKPLVKGDIREYAEGQVGLAKGFLEVVFMVQSLPLFLGSGGASQVVAQPLKQRIFASVLRGLMMGALNVGKDYAANKLADLPWNPYMSGISGFALGAFPLVSEFNGFLINKLFTALATKGLPLSKFGLELVSQGGNFALKPTNAYTGYALNLSLSVLAMGEIGYAQRFIDAALFDPELEKLPPGERLQAALKKAMPSGGDIAHDTAMAVIFSVIHLLPVKETKISASNKASLKQLNIKWEGKPIKPQDIQAKYFERLVEIARTQKGEQAGNSIKAATQAYLELMGISPKTYKGNIETRQQELKTKIEELKAKLKNTKLEEVRRALETEMAGLEFENALLDNAFKLAGSLADSQPVKSSSHAEPANKGQAASTVEDRLNRFLSGLPKVAPQHIPPGEYAIPDTSVAVNRKTGARKEVSHTHGARVIIPEGVKVTPSQLSAIVKGYNSLPKHLKKFLGPRLRIVLKEKVDPGDAKSAGGREPAGQADPSTHEIDMFLKFSIGEGDVLFHEMGHILDFRASGLLEPAISKTIRELYQSCLREYGKTIGITSEQDLLMLLTGKLPPGVKVDPKYQEYILRQDEVYAELFKLYIKEKCGVNLDWEFISGERGQAMKSFKQLYEYLKANVWENKQTMDKVTAQISARTAAKKPLIDEFSRIVEQHFKNSKMTKDFMSEIEVLRKRFGNDRDLLNLIDKMVERTLKGETSDPNPIKSKRFTTFTDEIDGKKVHIIEMTPDDFLNNTFEIYRLIQNSKDVEAVPVIKIKGKNGQLSPQERQLIEARLAEIRSWYVGDPGLVIK